MMFDISIVETGNGGDIEHNGNDFVLVDDIRNMPYLGMFGGNVIPDPETAEEEKQNFDFWGNELLMPADPLIQMVSITEKIMNTTALTSAGRLKIENAIKKDLEFLSPVAKIEVTVTIVSTDHINIFLRIAANIGEAKVIKMSFQVNDDGDFSLTDYNDDFFK